MSFWRSSSEETPDNIKQDWIIEGFKDCLDGFFIIQNNQFYISDHLVAMIGYTPEDENLLSQDWWEGTIHPDDLDRVIGYFTDRQKGKTQKKQIEYRLKHRAGHYINLLATTYIHSNLNGYNALMATIVNINSYRVLQDQLERTIEEAEKTSQTKSKFIASLNHELRTPLNGVMGMANLLSETSLSEEQKSYVQTILSSINMLLTLVNDVLDVSKIASGKLELEKVDFNLHEIISNTKNILNPSAAAKDLNFKCMIEEDVPEFFIGDQVRIQQILVNIINNAIKFTDAGEINLSIKLHEQTDEKISLVFRITDTGIGIPANVIPTLFSDFTQASPSTVRTHGGTGLGLSICKKLVTLMGGDIGVQSTDQKGSTFWFIIPFPAVNSQHPKTNALKSTKTLPNLKILVAEDNTINQQVIQGILKNLGQTITLANNGKEALDLFLRNDFDLVFMDINMPEMDGFQATSSLRQTPKGCDIPIIAFTADTVTISKQDYEDGGFTDTINKPISKDDLVRIIQMYAPADPSGDQTLAQSSQSEISDSLIKEHGFLYSLMNELGNDTMKSLLITYKTEANELIEKIEPEERIEEVHRIAHTLAGISENLGIKAVGKTARSIMVITKTEKTIPTDLIGQLRTDYTKSLDIIDSMLQRI